MSQLERIDKNYASWIEEISQRYKRSQIKAATHVNSEMLQFYWSLGKGIVTLKAESRWGEIVIANLSSDRKAKLPEVKGLSETNIGYAKRFYLLYREWLVIHPQVEGELQTNAIWQIPWGHHKYIIDKYFNAPEKAMFFVHKTLENGWSRNVLLNFMDTDLYERQGRAISNFKNSLPAPQSKFEYPQRATIQEQSETIQKAIQKTIQKQLSKQQEAILVYLSKYPYATRKELVENIPDATMGGIIHNLSRLQELGLLKRIGGRKQGCWQIVEP